MSHARDDNLPVLADHIRRFSIYYFCSSLSCRQTLSANSPTQHRSFLPYSTISANEPIAPFLVVFEIILLYFLTSVFLYSFLFFRCAPQYQSPTPILCFCGCVCGPPPRESLLILFYVFSQRFISKTILFFPIAGCSRRSARGAHAVDFCISSFTGYSKLKLKSCW